MSDGELSSAVSYESPRPARRKELWMYAFVRGVVAGFCRLYFRASYEGKGNVPLTGAFILSPVHRSNVDTLVVAGIARRRMRFLGKAEMWKYKLSAVFFNAMGGIKVERGTTDRDSMKACIEALKLGDPVVVFPEGTRRSGPVVEEMFEGAAYMACRAGVPVLPVGIGGSEAAMNRDHRLPRPKRIRVIIGTPIHPPHRDGRSTSRRAVHEFNEQLRAELQRLYDEASGR